MTEALWPVPMFTFAVDFGDQSKGGVFSEVSGLGPLTHVVEDGNGDTPVVAPVKLPEIGRFGNVTMKRGMLAKDSQLLDWFTRAQIGEIEPHNVFVTLHDQLGQSVMTWKLATAWPVKVLAADLKADSDKVALEEVELAHDGLTVAKR